MPGCLFQTQLLRFQPRGKIVEHKIQITILLALIGIKRLLEFSELESPLGKLLLSQTKICFRESEILPEAPGENILRIRKKKDLSQADLGKQIGTSGDVIGRYERGEMMPSIEAVTKIADALEVSIDFLVGKTATLIDKNMMDRLQDIEQLPDDKKAYILNLIDICLRDFKTQKAYTR